MRKVNSNVLLILSYKPELPYPEGEPLPPGGI
jgi:hypothetical protein